MMLCIDYYVALGDILTLIQLAVDHFALGDPHHEGSSPSGDAVTSTSDVSSSEVGTVSASPSHSSPSSPQERTRSSFSPTSTPTSTRTARSLGAFFAIVV